MLQSNSTTIAMLRGCRCTSKALALIVGLAVALDFAIIPQLSGQEPAAPLQPEQIITANPPVPLQPASPTPSDKPLPINLPTALQLSSSRPIDIAVASQRIEVAVAQLRQARLLWLPTLQF